jgi:hypothetical protein
VLEIRALRRIFGTKRDVIMEGWRILHIEELHGLTRRMRWAGHVVRTEGKRNAYKVLVRERKGKRPLRRLRRMWKDNINMDLREIGWGGVD